MNSTLRKTPTFGGIDKRGLRKIHEQDKAKQMRHRMKAVLCAKFLHKHLQNQSDNSDGDEHHAVTQCEVVKSAIGKDEL